jgi:hypothetical protein
MSTWRWVLFGLGVLLVAGVVFAYFFGLQTMYVWEAHKAARQEPGFWVKPVALTDLAVSEAPGSKLSYFGYEFDVPWDDLDQDKTQVIGKNKAIVVFKSGNVISFWTAPANEFLDGVFADGTVDRKLFAQMLGADAVKSDYNFKRTVLEFTPDSLSLFTPKSQIVQKGALIILKGVALPLESESGIYLLATEEFKGIQYGRPKSRQKHLTVELFNDEANLSIFFGNRIGGPTTISQADINRVVGTVHKVEAQQSGGSLSNER